MLIIIIMATKFSKSRTSATIKYSSEISPGIIHFEISKFGRMQDNIFT